MDSIENLKYPIGKYKWSSSQPTAEQKRNLLEVLINFPEQLREEVEGMNETQLQTPYREGGWSVAQVVHHLADSHAHSYLRCKHALLEKQPEIKDYTEADWASLEDATSNDLSPSLSIIEGIHSRWAKFFKSLSEDEFNLEYNHPERSKNYPLYIVLELYTWHSLHHLEHIRVLKKNMDWK